jgi:nucleotide-binding universal stress UspA family protein
MFNKLLVPLDGSPLAEAALPYAIKLGRALNSQLFLVQVVTLPPVLEGTLKFEEIMLDSAENYLKKVKELILNSELALHLSTDRIQTRLAYGIPGREIPKIAAAEKAEMIVLTTHGQSGFSQILTGSVASSIVQHSVIPVLMINPTPEKSWSEELQTRLNQPDPFGARQSGYRIVVTLDEPEEASVVLEPAVNLARGLKASIDLLHIVRPYLPTSTVEAWGVQHSEMAPDEMRAGVHTYLLEQAYAQVQVKVTEQGVECIRVLRDGEPAVEIEEYARTIQPAMLVMATHGRGRVGRALLGSVADEVVRQIHLPVLLVHR